MNTYTIYDNITGQVLAMAFCGDDDETPGRVYGDFTGGRYYIDVLLLVPVIMPPQPSKHHIFNYTTKQWEDPRTLDDLKAAQWEIIKQARTQAEYAGFTWDGSIFDSDAVSQNRITGAVTLAQLSVAFTIDWTLANNTVRTLGQMDMFQVGAALGSHVQVQFTRAQELRALIEVATTKAEVEAIVW
jgi:Domain of unknown function (DUF4376)